MARWSIRNIGLRGVSACVPKEIVRTEDIPLFTAQEAEVFNNTVGIRERRLAPDSICASDLCQAAAEKLLEELHWDKSSIDMLVFESVTGDYRTPPTSCLLQDRLGLSEDCFCLDIPMGCCGCMYAMNVAGNMLTTGNIKRALLLIGDTALRMGSMQDKSRVPLFGDCGTAIALEFDPTAEPILIDFHTQGSGYKALMTPHGGFRHPITQESFVQEDFGNGIVRAPKDTMIDGMAVFTFAISKPAKTVENLLNELNIDRQSDIDYYLIHQANRLIVDRLVKKLKLPPEKVPYNLEEFGNTGGASIPSLIVTRLAERVMSERPTRLLCSSFGLGLSWGTMLLTTKNLIVPKLIEI
ncbi:MAG: ketoacyl-ACP synthase III [Paludibacteraceae bacterium]|nr:ketoacyl-ACP synthase III [Paludibacteraceae bacterium]